MTKMTGIIGALLHICISNASYQFPENRWLLTVTTENIDIVISVGILADKLVWQMAVWKVSLSSCVSVSTHYNFHCKMTCLDSSSWNRLGYANAVFKTLASKWQAAVGSSRKLWAEQQYPLYLQWHMLWAEYCSRKLRSEIARRHLLSNVLSRIVLGRNCSEFVRRLRHH
jgi:hypothetical protein